MGHRLSGGSLHFTAISEWMMEHVRAIGDWSMIPNGVPLSSYDFCPHVPPDAPLVFLGRIEEIKGPHLAIEIARRTNRKLVIAGNIPSEKEAWVKAHVMPHVDGDRVTFIGPVDDVQKNRLLGSAAAFMMPILWEEPFGIVMAEAMACGTPVVGMRRGAVPEVVDHGVTGFVGDLGKIDRASCRLKVENEYSDLAVVEAYERLYLDLLGRSRQRA